jgi:tRNA(fMet)-specific endonuclease VapC
VGVLADTDVIIDAERGSASVIAVHEEVSISVVTLSELLQGAERGESDRATRRRAFVEQFLRSVEAIPVDEVVARTHARLWADLARTGRTLGVHDSWLAATALTHGLGILTRDAAFERVPGLRVVTP